MLRLQLLLGIGLSLALSAAEPPAAERQILWRAPKQLGVSDWIWGPGGEIRAPRPPFQFVKENFGGTNPKVDVRDSQGALWIVKLGGEVHTDTFASRLLFASGYAAEATYFVPDGVIAGVHGLKRAKWFVSKDGHFQSARFKLRDDRGLAYVDELQWSWIANPFLGTRELNGLKILVMLASNWDTKDARDGKGSNTAVFLDRTSAEPALLYSFTDWGASFGAWGGFFERDKWDAPAYERQSRGFVRRTGDGRIVWGFHGKHTTDIVAGITLDDIRWLMPCLAGMTDPQIRAGLMASGASQAIAESLTRSIRNRISQLDEVAGTRLCRFERTP